MKTFLLSFLFFLLSISWGCNNTERLDHNIERKQRSLHNPSSETVLVAAHRAFHTTYPENSIAAIQHSIDAGIDMIEIDVRQTKDGILVLMHDHTVNRTTNGEGEIKTLHFAHVSKLSLKTLGADKQVHPVPTLQEVLKLTQDKILVDIDIKDAPVKQLVEIVKKTKTEDQVLFFQHHNLTHDSLLLMDENLMVVPRAGTTDQALTLLKKYQPVVIQIPPEIASTSLVRRMKADGCAVWINALGDADDLAEEGNLKEAFSPLIELGATVIQSDRPDLLLHYLKEQNLH